MATTALAARVRGDDKRPEGIVSITAPEFFVVKVLAPNMEKFAAQFPGLTLEVRTGHSFLNLVRGEADIAIRNRPPDHQSLTMRRLGSVAISLWATQGYLDRFGMPDGASFVGHRMILFDESLIGMPGVRWLEGQISGAQVVMRSNELLPMMPSIMPRRPSAVSITPIGEMIVASSAFWASKPSILPEPKLARRAAAKASALELSAAEPTVAKVAAITVLVSSFASLGILLCVCCDRFGLQRRLSGAKHLRSRRVSTRLRKSATRRRRCAAAKCGLRFAFGSIIWHNSIPSQQ